MTYSDKLKDVKWQKRKAEIMARDNWCCRACFAHEGLMHVHHLRYLMYNDPWDYSDDDLITLCEQCHKEWHRIFNNNLNPGRTFLVAKLHFDLEIEAMQLQNKIDNFLYE